MEATSGSARKESVAALVGNLMVPCRGTSKIAVHKRHEILRHSWAVDLKPAHSRTTPFVSGAISLDEDQSSPLSASRS